MAKQIKVMDGEVVTIGSDVGYKDDYEKYGRVEEIRGDEIKIKCWDSDSGEEYFHWEHRSRVWAD